MEAKGSDDEAKDAKEEEPPSKVVIDLLNFAMRVVHEEMSGFFEQHCVLWDYKEEDLKKITAGEGETLEQHAVFTQYLEQINERLDGFARTAGYADAQGVLTDVQKAVDHDKKLRDQMMKEMNALFAQMRLGLEQRDKAAAGAKGTDARRRAKQRSLRNTPSTRRLLDHRSLRPQDAADAKGDDDSTASAKTVEVDESEAKESKQVEKKKKPMGNGLMLFSQPIGLEYLLESVMNLAEYETFRMMMIMKARERRMYRQLEERGNKRRRLRETRKAELVDGCSSDVVRDQYSLLKVRLGEMTPQRKDLREELDKGMDLDRFDFEGRIADPEAYKYAMDFLCKVSSPSAQEELKGRREDLTQQNAPHCDWLEALHAHIDAIHDNIEEVMLAARRGSASAEAKGAKA
jgi:broad-specificity NMP kinase